VSRDFSKKIRSFSKSAKKKLRYYRKFLTDDVKKHGCVRLVGVYKFTKHDDDETFYATLLRSACAPRATEALNEERDDDESVFDGELKKKKEKTRLVSEGACVRALEALGFEAFYGGDADEEWVAQVGGKQT